MAAEADNPEKPPADGGAERNGTTVRRKAGGRYEPGCLKKAGIGCLAVIVAILATMVLTGKRLADTAPPPPAADKPMDADILIPAFRINPEASREVYVGKRFSVVGPVAGFRHSGIDGAELLVRSDNGHIVFRFDDGAEARDLFENDVVVASGLCAGTVPGNAIVMEKAKLEALSVKADREKGKPASLALANRMKIERLKIKMLTQELALKDPRFPKPRNAFVLQLDDAGDLRSFDFTLSYVREPRRMSRLEMNCLGIVECCLQALTMHSYFPDELGITVTARAIHIPRGLYGDGLKEYGRAVAEPNAGEPVFIAADDYR